jgi:hypothetical protein
MEVKARRRGNGWLVTEHSTLRGLEERSQKAAQMRENSAGRLFVRVVSACDVWLPFAEPFEDSLRVPLQLQQDTMVSFLPLLEAGARVQDEGAHLTAVGSCSLPASSLPYSRQTRLTVNGRFAKAPYAGRSGYGSTYF